MSTATSKINDPDYQCKAYTAMLPALQLMRIVLGGTESMRGAGEKLLPKQPKEKDREYEARKKRSFMFNFTKKTRSGLVGMVTKEDPKLKESVPDLLRQHWENIDLAGTHGAVFAKQVFESAISDGHAFILVDMQPITSLPPGSTRADQQRAGHRPYWKRRTKDQAINFRPVVINGEETIGQITFEECSCEADGEYGEKEVTRYRTFRIPVIDDGKDELGNQVRPATYGFVEWELKRKVKGEGEQDVFIREGGDITSLTRIPVGVVYANQTGFLESEPLLLDLAYLNIDWWQQYSDYRTQLNKLVPFLKRVGMTPDQIKAYGDVATISPSDLIDLPKECDLAYVSHDGQALDSARQGILDTEQRAAKSGLSILTQRVDSNITATEKRMDQGERTSELATAARSLRDAIELCFGFHAQFLGLDDQMGDGGAVELGVQEDSLVVDPQMLAALNTMIDKGRFFIEDLFAYMQGGMKAIDFDDLKKRIEALPPVPIQPSIPAPANGNEKPMPNQGEGMMNGGLQ